MIAAVAHDTIDRVLHVELSVGDYKPSSFINILDHGHRFAPLRETHDYRFRLAVGLVIIGPKLTDRISEGAAAVRFSNRFFLGGIRGLVLLLASEGGRYPESFQEQLRKEYYGIHLLVPDIRDYGHHPTSTMIAQDLLRAEILYE